ncbi:SPOR domain-containing protein [Ferrigenium sp. UT5]|uniref:SPOR domain-containing protein n=1 Tax=Ferrigenium sp. UT5 TaxID=3242105 RepID=UPI003552FAC9
MSRVWLILLLLVNVLFFALLRWGALLAEVPDVLLAQAELNAEKITLLDTTALRLQAESEAASAAAVSAQDARAEIVAAPASRLSPELAAPPRAARCLAWGEFSGENLARINAALEALQLGDRLQRRTVEYAGGYWVYMPPQKNIDGVNKKIDQLRKLGVNDYFVVQEAGEWLHAISLGVFRTEQAARNFLEVLKTKGVRTAKVGERQSKLKFTVFEMGGIDAATEEKLHQMQRDFPDSELKSADCN